MTHYFDSSAIVKLFVIEPDSDRVRFFARDVGDLATSVLSRVEVGRVAQRIGGVAIHEGRTTMRRFRQIEIDDVVLDRASTLAPPPLRSLDAIHLAAALDLGGVLSGVVTYDRRMIDAARALGLPVVSP